MAETPYPYGDSPTAGDRLALLAKVFEPSTADFLDAAARTDARDRIQLAIDLGCGPGYTTRLVARRTGAHRTIGLESSSAFVARAREEEPPDSTVSFLETDVTRVPWPVGSAGPAQIVFARYLLAHLPEVASMIDRWLGQVAPGGRLLVEEIVSIDTDHPVLSRYVELVTELSKSHGNDLLVGAALGSRRAPLAGQVVHDEVVRIAPPVDAMANLFRLNLTQWRTDPWARATLDPAELDLLADDLVALAANPPPVGTITWHHRQIAWSSGRAEPPSGRR